MNLVIGIIVVLVLAAFYLLSKQDPLNKVTREEFLTRLAKHVGGQVEKMPEYENSFCIKINFNGSEFFYEDIQAQGFNDKVYKTSIRTKTGTPLNLIFSNKLFTK